MGLGMVDEHGTTQPPQPQPPQPEGERRTGMDRRATPLGRRAEDRRLQMRIIGATLVAFCGALVVMYLFFAAIGAVDLVDAGIFTIVAVVLTLVWLAAAYQRSRSGAMFITRGDRERRGF